MGQLEVREPERRLVRVLMRWKRGSVTAVARAAGVPQSNLSRLIGSSGSPGMSAAKLEVVLSKLGWSATGPDVSTVQRWTLDSEADVVWMFSEVLRGKAQVAVLVHGQKTLDLLDHVGLLLCYWGNARIVIDAATEQEQLIDLLLARSELAFQRRPVIVESENGFQRLIAGTLPANELDGVISAEREPNTYSGPIFDRLWELLKLLEATELDDLIHDVQVMKARSDPHKYAVDLAAELFDAQFADWPAGAERPRDRLEKLRLWAAGKAEADADEPYRLPWL